VSTTFVQAKAQAPTAPARPAPPQRAPIEIGRTDDPAEHEAERVAARLLAPDPDPHPHPTLRRCACGGTTRSDGACAQCSARRLDLRRGPAVVSSAAAPAIVDDVLAAPARPLDAATRAYFEPRLGVDLSGVRVHDDAAAADSARAVGAHAYTVGDHIAFADGLYAPATETGRRMLAHELTHVVQQRRATNRSPVLERLVDGSYARPSLLEYPPRDRQFWLNLGMRWRMQGDMYEQEAHRVSEQVTRMPEPGLQLPCACGGACPECQTAKPGHGHERLQMTRIGPGVQGLSAPSSIHEVLQSSGQPLDVATRTFMEPRFGHDFSRVRIHTDADAAQSARQLDTSAYALGDHIVFAEGRFAPFTPEGARLLAHELTHVVQQNGGIMAIQRGPGGGSHPTSSPADQTAHQRYLEALRELMSKPDVTDSTLSGIVEKLYRDNPEIGSGSTAAAIRKELETGMPTKGTFHLQKGQENMRKLSEWLADQKKLEENFTYRQARRMPVDNLHPLASARDIATAKNLYLDLQQAVGSGYYADIQIRVTPPPGAPGGTGGESIDPLETTVATPESAVMSSGFRTAGRFLAEEAPGLLLQLVLMALFPPGVNIHNDKAEELTRTRLDPAVENALAKLGPVFDKLLADDLSKSIYANVTARLDYAVDASQHGDLELSLTDVTFLEAKITNDDIVLNDQTFNKTGKLRVTKQITQSLRLYEPEYITRDREWAQAQRAYQECVQRYGTGRVPPAAGVGTEQGNPDEGRCIPPRMKPMEGP